IGAHRSIDASNVTTDVDVNGGSIQILIDTTITATASADSIGIAGLVSLSALAPTAYVNAYAGSYVRDGVNVDAGSLTIKAGIVSDRVIFTATATGDAVNLSALASGALVISEAIVGGEVAAFVGAASGRVRGGVVGAVLDVSGPITITAASDMDAITTVHSTSVAAIAINALTPTAWATGATRAYAGDGTNVKTTKLTILADSDVRANATTLSFAIGLGAGNGAGAEAVVASLTEAFVGERSDTLRTTQATVDVFTTTGARGTIDVDAVSRNVAHAQNDGVAAGLGVAVTVMTPIAKLAGSTSAYIGPRTTLYAGTVTLDAIEPVATAEATTTGATVGTVAVTVLIADAKLSRTTEAFVGHHAILDLGGSSLTATAKSLSALSTANASGGSGGIVDVGTFKATAFLGSDTIFLPALPSNPQDYTAARPTMGTRAVTRAYVGDGASVIAGNVTLDADAISLATATTEFIGISFIGVKIADTLATAAHDTDAFVGDNAFLNLTGKLSINANGSSTATPRITDVGISGLSLSFLSATSTVESDVSAWIGNGTNVAQATSVDVDAIAVHNAAVTINSSGFGFVLDVDVLTALAEDNGSASVRIGPERIRGAWASGETYYQGDVVTFGLNNYTAARSHASVGGNAPNTGAGMWKLGGGVSGSSGNPTIVTATGSAGITADAAMNSSIVSSPRFNSFSLFGAVGVATAVAHQDGTARATVGSYTQLSAQTGDVRIRAAFTGRTEAHASGVAGAIVGVSITKADADHDPTVLTTVQGSASLTAGSGKTIEVASRHNYGVTDPINGNGAIGSASNTAFGLVAGVKADVDATAAADVVTSVASLSTFTAPNGNVEVASYNRNESL
ncbi:MAG: hypothetical protein QNM02_04430, partial [Acidimicrobiia bacterium]|nr:hypothetical protein [Acidimicrobiia bacterium]